MLDAFASSCHLFAQRAGFMSPPPPGRRYPRLPKQISSGDRSSAASLRSGSFVRGLGGPSRRASMERRSGPTRTWLAKSNLLLPQRCPQSPLERDRDMNRGPVCVCVCVCEQCILKLVCMNTFSVCCFESTERGGAAVGPARLMLYALSR